MSFANVILAGVAAWASGLAWYAWFGPRRRTLAGTRPNRTGAVLLVATLGAMILIAGFLRHIFFVSGLTSNLPLGLVAGMGVGLFFIAPFLWVQNLAEGRPLGLTAIDGGYAIVATAIMGALLVAF
ncbi:MAG: DUF1761 domain-containing protein [Rhodobacteraceae bacterium]|jgi:protein-S-isoprenylcysteine O-methyltransferase Ste14|uniref:DUF1761 domain-containing protein n=1 Tax=Salipiger TaxID=263377 RepID=UPI0008EE92EB|nr:MULTISPECIES: DUF1761 domain-containing protein [Salipiger]MAB06460.1 DUF1761 domain-containing protein [Paracoccaceae bacterium]GFZ96813.1 hypothetical protein GCM10011326_05110 [Salipiger profundus]SFB80247.1 Protein of unknown function [Salipiger profundus]